MSSSDYPKFYHHGATAGVTGSCHHFIASADHELLIDCGLFQGEDERRNKFEQHAIDFDISRVKALVVTHVHIDHIGRLPFLIAAGYQGPIICSIPSAKLIPLVIEDALKVGFSWHRDIIDRFLHTVESHLVPVAYNEWRTIVEQPDFTLKVRLQRAGHILGSAYVEVDVRNSGRAHRTVFSGDLGAPHSPLLPAPKSPRRADTLVIESTYGDQLHDDRRQRKERLKDAIEHVLTNRGTVLIPAFSIGRTQELLYELEELVNRGGPTWRDLEIVVDSPLAAKFNEIYKQLKPYWDDEAQARLRAGRHPLSFENLITVDSHQDHLKLVEYLASSRRPAVVLAASGMANGGRILDYLKAMLTDEHHAVLFVGYQARGTIGRAIQQYGSVDGGYVDIDGRRYEIRAEVVTIGGYSAHADQKDLLNFVRRMHQWPRQIRIVHGDEDAKAALKDKFVELAAQKNWVFDIVIPHAESVQELNS